jgi:hypothetical protein
MPGNPHDFTGNTQSAMLLPHLHCQNPAAVMAVQPCQTGAWHLLLLLIQSCHLQLQLIQMPHPLLLQGLLVLQLAGTALHTSWAAAWWLLLLGPDL